MSLKPAKKSDMGKDWMKKRQDRPRLIQPEYHLIVTEGTDTEPQYFARIKTIINEKYRGRIQLDIFGEGDNTLSLFEKARRRALSSSNTYKHVWVIYDTDSFPAEHINQTAELCDACSTEDTQYHAIWSNQCIELWFLLHFSYFHSDIDRKGYWPKLSKCLNSLGCGDYAKNREDMYDILAPFLQNAIRNAQKLDQENEGKTASNSAPGTKVYELVSKLMPYL